MICAIAVQWGEAYSPATQSRPDSPETVTNCRNEWVKLGDHVSSKPRTLTSLHNVTLLHFIAIEHIVKSNNGRFGSFILLLVQWQYVRRILICSKRFQCIHFKKIIKAKMGVSAVKKKSVWQHGSVPLRNIVIWRVTCGNINFYFVRRARTTVTLCLSAPLFIASFLPPPPMAVRFWGGGRHFIL